VTGSSIFRLQGRLPTCRIILRPHRLGSTG